MTREIPLTQGKVARVSDHRFEYLSQWKWGAQRIKHKWYAIRSTGPKKHRVRIYMHRLIANPPSGMNVDHWDNDGLNNQDENLRICTRSQNAMNTGIGQRNTTGYKGITFRKSVNKWQAQIKILGNLRNLGYFSAPEEAARAYDKAAKERFGEFAALNFQE
jgi:hypothetical protein